MKQRNTFLAQLEAKRQASQEKTQEKTSRTTDESSQEDKKVKELEKELASLKTQMDVAKLERQISQVRAGREALGSGSSGGDSHQLWHSIRRSRKRPWK